MIEGDIFLISLGVMVRLLLVASVGAYAATRPKGGPPLLPEAAIQQLSRFSAVCLIPCIIVDSIGSSVSVELLRQSVALVVYGLVTIGLGLGYARLWGAVVLPAELRETSLWRVAALASGFPNIVAVPLVIVATVCERDEVRDDFDDRDECAKTGAAFIFMNSFVWSIVFFTFGVARLAAIKARRGGAGDAPRPPPPRGGPLAKFFSEPVNAALVVGTAVGMARPLQKALFVSRTSPLRALGGTIELLASPVVCLAILITGASFANVEFDSIGSDDAAVAGPKEEAKALAAADPELVEAAPPAKKSALDALRGVRPIVAGFILVRLVFVPATVVALETLLPRALPQKPIGRLILHVSSGMPSAQILIILLHKFGMSRAAADISFLFVFQYAASILTMTVLISLSLQVVY